MISDRLAFALGRLDLTPSYRKLISSVGQAYLHSQFNHYRACQPPVLLPFLCCEANGVNPLRAIGVTTSWFLLHVAAHVLDKVEDQELPVLELTTHGQGVCTNLSTGMIFVAEWILNHLELDSVDAGAAWDIQRAFQETILSVCSGQHLDLSTPTPDLSTCWEIAKTKSGSAFALACYAGTRTSTSITDRLFHFSNFGRFLGTIVQISDDLKDLEIDALRHKKAQTHSPLAYAYLSHLGLTSSDAPYSEIQSKTDLPSIQNSLVLYLRLEAMKYAEMARNELNEITLVQSPQNELVRMLNHLAWLGATVN